MLAEHAPQKGEWFLGIENLTYDHKGYVRWRGRVVEHYDYDFWRTPGWKIRQDRAARSLRDVCLKLEARGIVPTIDRVMEVYREAESLSDCPVSQGA